jgi:hypothetical protein
MSESIGIDSLRSRMMPRTCSTDVRERVIARVEIVADYLFE